MTDIEKYLSLRVEEEKKNKEKYSKANFHTEDSKEFDAIYNCIKSWDINVPGAYTGYTGANGNHVRMILNSLKEIYEKE